METFSALLAFVLEIHRSPVNSPHKGQWRGALMFSLISTWINDWVNNRKTGYLTRHRAHYDVTVMSDASFCKENIALFSNMFTTYMNQDIHNIASEYNEIHL